MRRGFRSLPTRKRFARRSRSINERKARRLYNQSRRAWSRRPLVLRASIPPAAACIPAVKIVLVRGSKRTFGGILNGRGPLDLLRVLLDVRLVVRRRIGRRNNLNRRQRRCEHGQRQKPDGKFFHAFLSCCLSV